MAAETVKLNSGYDMPLIGLGTWQVCNLLCSLMLVLIQFRLAIKLYL